jgi:hypothetical protein
MLGISPVGLQKSVLSPSDPPKGLSELVDAVQMW